MHLMQTAYLLTGGNMGNRELHLAQAKELIAAQCGQVVAASALYETAAWGNTHQPAFLNQVLQLKTPLKARPLMRRLLQIEAQMGRIRKEKYGPRIIDIDILLFNGEIHQQRHLTIPHPQLPFRRFALLPLAALAPLLKHPILKKNINCLLATCNDKLAVKKI
ncbi:MAG: 2-amino-4-hydroxy-6-hydroxymethyldihydropteridine diphosphokinase [Bacteroidota bacterium]